jgi:hypothetical protein
MMQRGETASETIVEMPFDGICVLVNDETINEIKHNEQEQDGVHDQINPDIRFILLVKRSQSSEHNRVDSITRTC